MSTYFPRADEVRNDWYVLDAADLVLGRVATRAAMVLMGKHKPDYTPFLKTGDHVVIINAELRKQLKKDGLLTSDARVKERKKYGMAGARKRFQFSKR